jgi:hypothetical protein
MGPAIPRPRDTTTTVASRTIPFLETFIPALTQVFSFSDADQPAPEAGTWFQVRLVLYLSNNLPPGPRID